MDFITIDFETATGYRNSICQVGLVRVENGIITQEVNLLVQPPDNYYWSRFTDIHGISAKNTSNAQTFDQIWHQIAPYIENQNVVAHNGFGFDFPVSLFINIFFSNFFDILTYFLNYLIDNNQYRNNFCISFIQKLITNCNYFLV